MLKVIGYYAVFTPLSAWLGNVASERFATDDKDAFLYWALPYIIEIITMIVNFITEFLFDRFVVFGNSINTNELAQKKLTINRTDIIIKQGTVIYTVPCFFCFICTIIF